MCGRQFHHFEGQLESADDRLAEVLGCGAVQAYVVGSPPAAEDFAAGGEFSDEVGQRLVAGVAAGLHAQQLDGVVGDVYLGGLKVSQIGLGAMSMSGYNTAEGSDAESIRAIHRAIDLGVSQLDTAEIYGPYGNEELVGRAIKDRRGQTTAMQARFADKELP